MKKIILTVTLGISGLGLWAQPVLEHIYTESANICNLESRGEVYYSMDVINKQCHIYNMDHTLYKSIPIPTPEGYYLSDVQHVSERLFNSDDLIELVYSYTKYVPTETSYYYTYETKLINENGNIMISVPGAGYTQVIDVPDQGKKFLVYEYNYSVIPYRTYTHVYNLPETTTKSADYYTSPSSLSPPFPNPASRQVTIPVELPEGIQSAQLYILDVKGNMVMNYPVIASDHHVVLSTRSLTPGTYVYQVDTGSDTPRSGKIVIGE